MALFYHPPPLFLPPPTPATGHLLPSAVLATLPLPLSSPVDPSESPIDLSESSPIDETYLWLSPPFSPRWTREDDEALENAIAFNGALDSEAIAAAGSTRDDDKALENVIPVNGALDSEAIAPAAWTRDDDKALENAIAFNGAPDSEAIAGAVPGKTADEVRRHYGILVEDLDAIEAGRVPIPKYALDGGWSSDSGFGTPRPKSERVRRKGTPWSEQEHRDFLLGLKMCAKGDWRSISRYYVISRTPTQVASHAQKYFIRQSCTKKDRRRTSIHDITTASIHDIASAKHPSSPSLRQ